MQENEAVNFMNCLGKKLLMTESSGEIGIQYGSHKIQC